MKNSINEAGNTAQTTIAPVQATPAKNAKAQSALAADIERRMNDPEFVDAPGLQALFAIKRSLAYQLVDEGLIRAVSLRRRGMLKGKRLFDVASVRAYLNSLTTGGA